jgi:hypothetical protein
MMPATGRDAKPGKGANIVGKGAVAPSGLLSYTGISPERVTAMAADASKVLDAALPKQPREIMFCVKGEVTERIWVAKGKMPNDLRCVTG